MFSFGSNRRALVFAASFVAEMLKRAESVKVKAHPIHARDEEQCHLPQHVFAAAARSVLS
jgi:hypothetical protein